MVLRKLSQSFKLTMAVMLSVLSSGMLQTAPAFASSHQVDICHATGSESNPYIQNSPAKTADVAGHDNHHGTGPDVVWYPGAKDEGVDWDDIIPPFDYEGGTYPGKNWTVEGQAIYNNGCNTATTSLNIDLSTCVDSSENDGILSITISGSFENGSKLVLKQGTSQVDVSGPINNDDDLPVIFSNLSAGTYIVSLEKGNTVYASETVTLDECNTPTPLNPTVTAAAQPCTEGDATTDVLVTVTNTNDDTDAAQTYDVTIGTLTLTTSAVADGSNGTVTFEGLAVGTHTVNVTLEDGTDVLVSTSVTVAECGGRGAGPCTVSDATYLSPWMYGGFTQPYTGAHPSGTPGAYEFKTDGLYLSTPNRESYVSGEVSAGNTKLIDIEAMSYKTLRLITSTGGNQVVTAYIIQVDLDGDLTDSSDVTYLFYEPVYNGTVQTGTWQTWDVFNDGNSVWWSFELTDGNPSLTWNEVLADYPNAVAISFGFNQGTWNEGTNAAIQDMEFDCATISFGKAPVLGDNDIVTDTKTGGSGQGNVQSASTELPETLPATGGESNPFLILIASLIAYGAAYFLQGRRLLGRSSNLTA